MIMKFKLSLVYTGLLKYFSVLSIFFFFAACNENAERKEETVNESSQQEALELSEQQMNAVGITLGKIEFKNLKSVVKANGQLEVPPQNKAEVQPMAGGIVKKISVLEGNYVRKGQPLVTLENPGFIQIQQDYLASKNALSLAAKEYERQKELMDAKAGTGKVFQQAESNYLAEQLRYRTLTSQLKQMGFSIHALDKGHVITQLTVAAPITGVVGHILATTGSFAASSQTLLTITDNSRIHCDLLVYEKDLFKVKSGQKVEFILTNQNNQRISGVIYGINKTFENDTKAVIAHARIDNPSNMNLIPGMYVSALIKVGNQTTTAVPLDAIITAQEKNYIFMADNQPGKKTGETEKLFHFKQVEVVTGVSDLGYTEITLLHDIPKDALIITKGAFYLQSKISGSGEEE